jgi:hypothetical protein
MPIPLCSDFDALHDLPQDKEWALGAALIGNIYIYITRSDVSFDKHRPQIVPVRQRTKRS